MWHLYEIHNLLPAHVNSVNSVRLHPGDFSLP